MTYAGIMVLITAHMPLQVNGLYDYAYFNILHHFPFIP